ncbi:MAG: hypothetical protein JST51_05495 [Armatimonadetes bacterium]|nr:hypothetical protein [Armatimonadota bacterium]
MPPPDAPLVKFRAVWTLETNRPWRERSECAYLLEGTKGEYDESTLMLGTAQIREVLANPVQIVNPKPPNLDDLSFGESRGGVFREDGGLAVAVIERIRHHDAFALAIINNVAENPPSGSYELTPPQGSSLQTRMHYLAFQHWINSLVDPKTDRIQVLNELTQLGTQDSKMTQRPAWKIVKNLDLAVHSKDSSIDPIEIAIDHLSEMTYDGLSLERNYDDREHSLPQLLDLESLGYQVVPHLIKHFSDERLSRAQLSGTIVNMTGHIVTVGEICTNLTEHFFKLVDPVTWPFSPTLDQRQSEAKAWWSKVSKLSDFEKCRTSLANSDQLPQAALLIAQRHYPELLLQTYNAILAKNKKTQTSPLLEAMVQSALPSPVTFEACLRGARSKNPDQSQFALQILSKLDKGSFESELTHALDRLPQSMPGDESLLSAGSFGLLTCKAGSPAAWQALLKATKRADVDLRLELIGSTNWWSAGERNRTQLLNFLAEFFEDQDVATSLEKERGELALLNLHPFLPTFRVQDLATIIAAKQFGMEGHPNRDAPRDQWDRFRAEVRKRIELKKNPKT